MVYSETRRALDAVDDPTKVIAWVATRRNPHAGDPMPAHDLYRILVDSKAGLQRFICYPDLNRGAPECSVTSATCGKPWRETLMAIGHSTRRNREPSTEAASPRASLAITKLAGIPGTYGR